MKAPPILWDDSSLHSRRLSLWTLFWPPAQVSLRNSSLICSEWFTKLSSTLVLPLYFVCKFTHWFMWYLRVLWRLPATSWLNLDTCDWSGLGNPCTGFTIDFTTIHYLSGGLVVTIKCTKSTVSWIIHGSIFFTLISRFDKESKNLIFNKIIF